MLVHLSGGFIEAHLHFFVILILLTLYEDWTSFLLAAAYVVIHHGTVGTLDPSAVYNHPDAIAHPWKWAVIHALFVTAAGGVLTWRLNEEVREGARKAYGRARESEELFKGAFENAPVGMALVGVGSEQDRRMLRVNRAMSEITGYSEEEVVGRSFAEVTHPDDREAAAVLYQGPRRRGSRLRGGDALGASRRPDDLRPCPRVARARQHGRAAVRDRSAPGRHGTEVRPGAALLPGLPRQPHGPS